MLAFKKQTFIFNSSETLQIRKEGRSKWGRISFHRFAVLNYPLAPLHFRDILIPLSSQLHQLLSCFLLLIRVLDFSFNELGFFLLENFVELVCFRVQDFARVIFHPVVLGIEVPLPSLILCLNVSPIVLVSLLSYFLQVLFQAAGLDLQLLDFVDVFRKTVWADDSP